MINQQPNYSVVIVLLVFLMILLGALMMYIILGEGGHAKQGIITSPAEKNGPEVFYTTPVTTKTEARTMPTVPAAPAAAPQTPVKDFLESAGYGLCAGGLLLAALGALPIAFSMAMSIRQQVRANQQNAQANAVMARAALMQEQRRMIELGQSANQGRQVRQPLMIDMPRSRTRDARDSVNMLPLAGD